MNNKLIEIKAYVCPVCNKTLRSRNHFCWKDPENRACHTCEGWQGWEETWVPNFNLAGDEIDELHRYAACKITGKMIYDYYHDESEIEFGAYRGKRGYMCPHWKKRDE